MPSKALTSKLHSQSGITLIETLAAAFIMIMGVSAAVGLASYSLKATQNIRQQTVALGLAREGIEVVKNMRDTNWLKADIDQTCHDFLVNSLTPEAALCYLDWLNPASGEGYNISADGSYGLSFNPNNPLPWSLVEDEFGLEIFDAEATGKLYSLGDVDPKFFRKIILEKQGNDPPEPPYNEDTGPRLKVTSIVWWEANNCPAIQNGNITPGAPCSITLETYLTNWRNF